MADSTLKRLVQLVDAPNSPDLKLSALKVLGSVGPNHDAALEKALLNTLDDPAAEMRCAAIETLGQLHIEAALPRLEAFIREGREELEPAVQAATQLGTRGGRLISKLMDLASPGQRSRMAQVLAKSGTGNALVVTAHALLDSDAKVVEAAARSLAAEVPNYSPAQRQPLARFLIDALQGKEKPGPVNEAALLRVLGALHDARAAEAFWKRLDPARPAAVRAAALHGLGVQAKPPSAKHLQQLFRCAEDGDFQVVASALMILKNVPVDKKKLGPWLKLMQGHDVAARRFVLDKLRGQEGKDWARALVAQLRHPDRTLREDALAELCRFAAGGDAIIEELLTAEHVEECWSLARALASKLEKRSPAQRTRVFAQACTLCDQEDRRAAPLWFLLRELDSRWVREQIEKKAAELRARKKYTQAIHYYRILLQDPACGEDIRFEFAAIALKESAHDLALASRQEDAGLAQLDRLLENPAFDLMGQLKKTKGIDAADLLYVGFHFVERTHRARDFGQQVLELVLQRFPKSEQAKSAKRKLKSEALL